MPYHIYMLRSINDESFYIGSTSNLHERIRRHNKGYCCSTKHHQPFKLVHKEEFSTRPEATKRERYLKSLKNTNNNYLVQLIKEQSRAGR